MAVDTNFASLFQNLKLEDPWLQPRPWESIPRESGGGGGLPVASTSQSGGLYDASAVSEASLVRLAMNALHGIESSLLSIDKLCAEFCSCPADRTFHRTPSLWNRSLSTSSLGKILKSIGCMGCEVFLLRNFVDYFTILKVREKSRSNEQPKSDFEEEQSNFDRGEREYPPYSLVNHAFAKAVGKVLEGYISSLDTLYSSVGLRRSLKIGDASSFSDIKVGCLTSVGHEFTLLEVYLHTKGLRTQIEALGYVCNVHHLALCFSQSPFENLSTTTEFSSFPRGGNLLTYLYSKLKVADTGHSALLKILFLRSCEPYFGLIRSWIFKAKISDPFNEFIVANADTIPSSALGINGISVDMPSATISEREGVSVPCFLRDFLTPLCRAGQQLQVLMKLLELCDNVGSWNHTYEDFLPYWSEMPSNSLYEASPLAFNKEDIEATVTARNNYYKYMREKLEGLLTNLEFRYEQAIPHRTVPSSVYNSKRSMSQSFSGNNAPISPSAKNRNQNLPVGKLESDSSCRMLESSCVEESLESSDYSSFTSSEEDEDAEELSPKLNEFPDDTVGQEQKYLSALSFYSGASLDMSLQKPSQRKMPCIIKSDSCEASERTCLPGYFPHPHPHDEDEDLNDTSPLGMERNLWTLEAQDLNNQHEVSWPIGGLLENPFCVGREKLDSTWSHVPNYGSKASSIYAGVLTYGTSNFSDPSKNFLREDAAAKDQHPIGNSFSLKPWKVKYHPDFLSMNPMLTKNSFVHWTSKPGDRCFPEYIKCIPSFEFTSVKDPCKVYVNRSAVCSRHVGHKVSVSADSACISRSNFLDKEGYNSEKVYTDKISSSYVCSPSNMKANVSGGSGWEILLCSSGKTAESSVREQKETATLELPLDYIIEKYLLEEIQLQYKYVSNLTMMLLEEGFHLQKHLLALRRYHLMESADWADLFILSLQHHKWYIPEADKRISEIQGLLELSLQRSSCETDGSKDRLYVYLKEPSAMPLPASSAGIHSLNVLGLGYRVDWPVSIILTPVALKIYAEIFSFLMQVKLAVSSLTEVWRSFKELKHLNYQKRRSESRDSEAFRFNILMRLRQQVYHFVTTLQQYVQSQLSQVSWCRFLHSVKHKVKDVMDLESAHMEYLSDSLHVCFLSNEMGAVADIVQSILQCALDLRSSLAGSTWDAGLEESFPCTLSHINFSQVVMIKENFEKNIKELYLYYLKSPRNLEFGLARFWEYLDYNEHYSGVMGKEFTPYALYI